MGDQAPHPVWTPGMFCPDWGPMALIPEAEEMGSSNNGTAEAPRKETDHRPCRACAVLWGASAPRGERWEGAAPKQLSSPCQTN